MHDVTCGRNAADEHMQRVSTDEHSEASIASGKQELLVSSQLQLMRQN